MKHKIFSHTSLLIILSVILTFLAAGTVMYNRYDIYMKQGVRDEAAYIKTGLEEDGDVFLSDRVGDATSSRITQVICWSARSMDTRYRTEPMSPPFSSRITRVMAMAFSPVFRVPIHWPSPLGFCRAVS